MINWISKIVTDSQQRHFVSFVNVPSKISWIQVFGCLLFVVFEEELSLEPSPFVSEFCSFGSFDSFDSFASFISFVNVSEISLSK